ncbi:hypothetical protein N7530_002104 [Penicillium desertorum]|uniref:Post-GPI attachment to proteins factor 3 n=1 Tax=Penicillium desertorum TaxID=1303715 RepID=A0A9W9XBQ1_9EURO|nr:hypothetical protein N7530_002104 [Penicillium desertorum]
MNLGIGRVNLYTLFAFVFLASLIGKSNASLGDHLPDFKECVQVCKTENCQNGNSVLPLHHRLLLWTCPAECDYTCQHVITDRRVSRDPPMISPVVQFHGKWPFRRLLGMQEPFSVLFSFFNFAAHWHGMSRIQESIPAWHSLRPYYMMFGYIGLASWSFSMIFHMRDFPVTEKLDYWGGWCQRAVRSLPCRRSNLPPGPRKHPIPANPTSVLDCYLRSAIHIALVGIIQNLMWTGFSIFRYRRLEKSWAAWPGMIVAWIIMAMSLELLDFPPWNGLIDAHSLWHLGTVVPAVWWYSFLIKDAQDDIAAHRLKA